MKLFIPMRPKPAPRHRMGNGRAYNKKEYTEYKQAIAYRYKAANGKIHHGPVFMQIEFFFKYQKSWSKKKKEAAKWHTSKPDVDNLVKAIKDALNGIAYRDDSQVCQIHARKQYADRDCILIEITC